MASAGRLVTPPPWIGRPGSKTPSVLLNNRGARSTQSERVAPRRRAAAGRRILALCLGGIGDTVLAFAALRDLRRACPDDHLTALTMWPQSRDLLEDLGVFDAVLQHNFQTARCWRSAATVLKLRKQNFDVSLLAFPANRFEYNLVSRLLGARLRYGHTYHRGGDRENLRFLLTDAIPQVLGRHVVDENRALVAQCTGQRIDRVAETRLGRLAAVYHEDAERMLAHLPRPLVGIHPGSSSFKGLTTKRWPVERFGELCHRIESDLHATPVVFGNPDEIDLKLKIQRLCPQIFFAHGPTIRHTAALMARCTAFVSNDSALAHLASAAGVSVVMICGPTDWREVGPYGGRGRALVAPTPCSPCFEVGRQPMTCTQHVFQACLKGVGIDRVLFEVRRIVDAEKSPSIRSQRHSLPVLDHRKKRVDSPSDHEEVLPFGASS